LAIAVNASGWGFSLRALKSASHCGEQMGLQMIVLDG